MRGRFRLHRDAQGRGRAVFHRWYSVHASEWLADRVDRFSKRVVGRPVDLRVLDLKNRWGLVPVRGRHQRALGDSPVAPERYRLRACSRTRAPEGAAPHTGVLDEGRAGPPGLRNQKAVAGGGRGRVHMLTDCLYLRLGSSSRQPPFNGGCHATLLATRHRAFFGASGVGKADYRRPRSCRASTSPWC